MWERNERELIYLHTQIYGDEDRYILNSYSIKWMKHNKKIKAAIMVVVISLRRDVSIILIHHKMITKGGWRAFL